MKAQPTVLFLLAALLFGACGTSAYEKSLEQWTRSEDAYADFEARAFIDATLKAETFRRAYVREYARLYDLTPSQESDLLTAELADARDNVVVIVSFYTPERRWNDLNPARGFWEVRLQNTRGDAVGVKSVTRLDARNPAWRWLFPYFGKHENLYELRFDRLLPDQRPLDAAGEKLTLVVAGAPVRIHLDWQLP